MRLLVSVRGAAEASTVASCGVDIVDAKEPLRGSLGPVDGSTLRDIVVEVGKRCPVSAALGDAPGGIDHGMLSRQDLAGLTYVKLGLGGCSTFGAAARALDDCIVLCGNIAVVLVAYADWQAVDAPTPHDVVSLATDVGANGVLLDTASKVGGSLFAQWSVDEVTDWVAAAHEHGLEAAIAGRLAIADFGSASRTGADIIGIRGAICTGGRSGCVSEPLVRRAVDACRKGVGRACQAMQPWLSHRREAPS